MKRAREDRGKDKWERISWEEAYDIAETQLNAIKEKYGAESVVFIHGHRPRHRARGSRRLCCVVRARRTYGNVLSGNACYLPRVAGMAATTGSFWVAETWRSTSPTATTIEGWTMPEVMFVWGNNPIVANSDGCFGHWVIDLHEARHEGSSSSTRASRGLASKCRPVPAHAAPAPTRRWPWAC